MVVNLMDYLSLNRIQFSNALTKEAVIAELIRVVWEDGKVENVVEGIGAAFINIGLGQNGFLPFAEVGKEYDVLTEKTKIPKKLLGIS